MNALLTISDVETLQRKLGQPSPSLAGLYARFCERLEADPAFRANNLFLPALLGDSAAVAEARQHVLEKAAAFGRMNGAMGNVEHHTWCVAPDIMRYAVYYTWLVPHAGWSKQETNQIAESLLHFCREHVVAVLRSRIPSGNNQSLSMALTCAVVGAAFPGNPQAAALEAYGVAKVKETLGLFDPSGYSGEGSTYQTQVISPLLMWTYAFLMRREGVDCLSRPFAPKAVLLRDLLCMESRLGSPGSLLPPWDHYGWQQKINLAAIAFQAGISGAAATLDDAAEVWDRESFIAWNRDDRMWALLYWPETQSLGVARRSPDSALSGWTLPTVAATLDHDALRARLMMAWDRSADDLQTLGRAQVNPNHLMLEIGGVPIFGDGIAESESGFLGLGDEQIAAPLRAAQRQLIVEQYGGLRGWVAQIQNGVIGAANAVVVDGERGYFPVGSRVGRLVCERRNDTQHLVSAESVAFYRPTYDLDRVRRSVSMDANGVIWIIDDIRAATAHRFTWQVYLRQGGELNGDSLRLHTPEGVALTLAWASVDDSALHSISGFPQKAADAAMAWPENGSDRLELCQSGSRAVFAVVIVPESVECLRVRATSEGVWSADWDGGSSTLSLPAEAMAALPDVVPEQVEDLSDLDAEPFGLLDEPTADLLAALQAPAPDEWRRTTAAMQTLVARGEAAVLPICHRLLVDAKQRYQVQSVAAWCLGRMRYAPALADLRMRCDSPETNTAARCRWAVESLIQTQ